MRRERKRSRKEKDKRRLPRKHLVFYLRVFDDRSRAIIGHLADITEGGLMLVCERPIETDRDFRLRMKLPREVAGRTEIVLEATCVWCRKDANPDFHLAGFTIKAPDEELQQGIRMLVEDFSIEESLTPTDEERPACNLTHTTGR